MASPLHFLLPLLVAAVAPDGWLGIYLDQGRPEAVVVEVIPESPAAKAGLQVGDVIVRIGDTGPVARERLRVALAGAKPGDRLELAVRRGDKEHRVVVRLGERPEAAVPKPEPAPRPSRPGQPPQPAGESPPAPATATAPAPAVVPPPIAPAPPVPAAAKVAAADAAPAAAKPARGDVEAEVAALRAELAALRRQLEALRQGGGRE